MRTKDLLVKVNDELVRLISMIHQHHATSLDPNTKFLFEESKQAVIVLWHVREKIKELKRRRKQWD